MQIKNYTCDLCGAVILNLSDTEEIQMYCTAENYSKRFHYIVCPYCADIFKCTNESTIEEVLLNHIKAMVGKYEK